MEDSKQLEDGIYTLPELPDEIKDAVEREELVVFLGAGVSRMVGCPGWNELADALLKECYQDGNGSINFWEYRRLQQDNNPRKKISIAKSILPSKVYINCLISNLKADKDKLKAYPIFKILYRLRATYVTTNIDNHFESNFVRSNPSIIKRGGNKDYPIEGLSLFYLHGSIKEPHTIIFTIKEYIEQYNDRFVIDFLKTLFDKTVLFVGYSLSELEVLDYILLKGKETAKAPRHYLLLPFYKTEQSLLKYEKAYFRSLNVNVVPYAIDEIGHNQLYHVIEQWEKEINIATSFLLKAHQFLEDNIEEYIEENANKVLQLLNNDENLRVFWFKNLKAVDWFELLQKEGYFSPDKAPEPRHASTKGYFSIPSWNVLPYLEKVSLIALKDGYEKYIDELLTIIKDVTDYHVEHGRKLDNYRTWSSFVKILLNLPLDKISIETVGFIKEWLTSKFGNASVASDVALKLLPKLLDSSDSEDWEKAEKIVEIITEIKWIPLSKEIMNISEKKEETETLVERYVLLKSFEKNAVKIGEKCGKEVIMKLADRLKTVLKRDGKDTANDYSYIWIRSLFNISNHSIYDTKATLTVILKDVLLAKASKNREETEEILNAFLNDTYPYPIFKRVALLVIGREWDKYKDFFWEIIDSKKIEGLFENSNYKPELYMLLKNNITKFSENEKERIKSIIAKGPSKYLPETEKGKYVAYWKQEWYSAMKADAYFLALYNAEHEITGTEVAPMFLKEPEVRWVGSGGSPLSEDEILAMTNIKLAEYLKTFKASGDLDAPTVRGLAELLKVVVKEEPKKIIAGLTPFMDVGFIYLHEILSGIKEARDENKYIEWEPLLNFIMNYMERDDFWEDKFIIKEPSETFYGTGHQCIVQIVAELILIGVEDTVWSMSEEGFSKAEDIIFLILKRLDVEKLDRKTTDLIALSLWTPLARTLIAMIFLAVNIDKTRKKKNLIEKSRWPNEFRKKYDEMLKNNYIESYTVFGEYLSTLLSLDKSWVQNKIASFEKRMGEKQIEVFVGSYLYRGKVHKDIYDFLKPYYLYYIEHPLSERHAEELLIQQICVGYLQGWEDIEKDESLFRKVLNRWDVEQLLEVINFFWMLRKSAEQSTEEYETTRKKICEFWEWMYKSKFESKKVKELNDSDKRILSKLTLLTVFLDNISAKAYKWVALSAPYVDVEHNSSFFIEYLDKFKEDDKKSMEYVGQIFLEMLHVFTPYFFEEEILSIVGKLYKAGQKESANKICNIYLARNEYFLKDIYEENND